MDRYHRAIESYAARLREVHGVRSIYTMGSIKAPGLSDLDVIVVVDDDFEPRFSARLSVRGVDDRLFIHGPVVVPASLAGDLQYIIYATGLTRLHGDDDIPEFHDLTCESRAALRFAYLIDFLESRQVQYTDALNEGRVDQRAWMTRLWSLTHSEALLDESGLNLESRDRALLDRIRDLRRRWIDSAEIDSGEFVAVFLESIHTGRRMLFAALQGAYGDSVAHESPTHTVSAGNKLIVFDASVPVCEYRIWGRPSIRRRLPLYVARWNPIYAEHLRCYGFSSNSKISCSPGRSEQHLSKRASVVKRHWEWLGVHCPDANSLAGYLGLRPAMPHGPKARARAGLVAALKLAASYGHGRS
jgi:hypothetical protein